MSGTPDVSFLIVTWNGWPLLERALDSIARWGSDGIVSEVIVVDNASSDETRERVSSRYPTARLIAMGENAGFARANNVGAREAGGEWIFLLNNDAELSPDALTHLVDAGRRHPGYDVLVPQMVVHARPSVVDNRGIMVDHTGHFRQIDSGLSVASGPACGEVFGGSGGAVMVRRRLLERVPLFDEALGSYLEDADFAARSRVAGARALYVGDAIVRHVGSATAGRLPVRKALLVHRNLLALRRRWLSWRHVWWRAPLIWGYELFRAARLVVDGMPGVVRDAWRQAPGVEAALQPLPLGARGDIYDWIGVKFRVPEPKRLS